MTYADKHIVKAYSRLLEGLSDSTKMKLIENLANSLKEKNTSKESSFFKSFGAFESAQSAEEIIAEIRSSRKFRKNEISF